MSCGSSGNSVHRLQASRAHLLPQLCQRQFQQLLLRRRDDDAPAPCVDLQTLCVDCNLPLLPIMIFFLILIETVIKMSILLDIVVVIAVFLTRRND